jgi:hypothetical protein
VVVEKTRSRTSFYTSLVSLTEDKGSHTLEKQIMIFKVAIHYSCQVKGRWGKIEEGQMDHNTEKRRVRDTCVKLVLQDGVECVEIVVKANLQLLYTFAA